MAVDDRRQELPGPGRQNTADALDKGNTVVGEVFASPYRLQVQGSLRKAGRETMVLAYPDICFAVDGSHTGFDQLVWLSFNLFCCKQNGMITHQFCCVFLSEDQAVRQA